MLSNFKVFHHRPDASVAPPGGSDPQPEPGEVHGHTQQPTHVWSRLAGGERRLKRQDECFRGLVELEAELLHEVEREA